MNRLKEAREAKNLSQKSVSISLGVSKQAVSLWQSSSRTPSSENYVKLAALYGVSVDYLMGNATESTDNAVNTENTKTTKQPSTIPGEGQDELYQRIMKLDDAGRQRVLDFLAGMSAK